MNNSFAIYLKRFVPAGLALASAVALLAPGAAHATPYSVTLVQHQNSVTATGSGAFDLTGLSFFVSGANAVNEGYIMPNAAVLSIGAPNNNLDVYTGLAGPTSFGSGTVGIFANTFATGDEVTISGSYPALGEIILLPQGYISDSALMSSSTWLNASFASLGVTPGTYTWTWGTGPDQSFTMTTAVPEPGVLGMFGFGVLLIGGLVALRRRRNGSA